MTERFTAPDAADNSSLIQQALAALDAAAHVQLEAEALLVEERNVWHPNSWLLQRCWETLADAGAGAAALSVVKLLEARQPLAPLQAIYRLARQAENTPALQPLIRQELQRWQYRLLQMSQPAATQPDQLLLLAAGAALIGDRAVAAACLEHIDQISGSWRHIIPHPELREQLALAITHIGLHPLTTYLITSAIRRFDDAGVQLLQEITIRVGKQVATHTASPMTARLLLRCIDTVRHATLVTLQSRRIATAILGQAGQVEEVLRQLAVMQSVQSAQRATGYTVHKEDPTVLRQVKRTSADADIDFLVYTLCNAVAAMPVRQLAREQRIALADQLALLGVRSDGWTAASAAATLIDLGALKYATEVVDHVPPHDPIRSEGMLTLVRGLLTVGEEELAAETAQSALRWARAQRGRNPERALTWGLAEIYLQHQQPAVALTLLERWREPTGWQHRLRTLWREALDDDALRNRSLRLHALLQQSQMTTTAKGQSSTNGCTGTKAGGAPGETQKEIQPLLRTLNRWAPRLLDGEALIHFYVDKLLQPLLEAKQWELAWTLLPPIQAALATSSGNRLAVRVAEVATLLAAKGLAAPAATGAANSHEGEMMSTAAYAAASTAITSFLVALWQQSAQRGVWQVVHTLEGSLPLLLALVGADGIVQIARGVAERTDGLGQ